MTYRARSRPNYRQPGPPRAVTGKGEANQGFAPPALWVQPDSEFVAVLLPPQRTAEPDKWFFRHICKLKGRIKDGPRRSWLIERAEADACLHGMYLRYGPGKVTLIVDVRNEGPCFPACVRGKKENALQCECPCGGINHGGLNAAGWERVRVIERSDGIVRHVWRV